MTYSYKTFKTTKAFEEWQKKKDYRNIVSIYPIVTSTTGAISGTGEAEGHAKMHTDLGIFVLYEKQEEAPK